VLRHLHREIQDEARRFRSHARAPA
jgi:hypothetical protein